MPKYNDNFSLDIKDIDLIETALRCLWAEESVNQDMSAPSSPKIKNIHKLLGKIGSQKIHYSEVNLTSSPIG
ncbi:MAG: hypothetical protein ACI9J2_002184 [Saprospiraceae bacterium]|jgi:hypothetical protein